MFVVVDECTVKVKVVLGEKIFLVDFSKKKEWKICNTISD